jgi:hypothetical protein
MTPTQTKPDALAAFPGRRNVERAIHDAENPTGMQLNDGMERHRLPGGTLRRMLVTIDRMRDALAAEKQRVGDRVETLVTIGRFLQIDPDEEEARPGYDPKGPASQTIIAAIERRMRDALAEAQAAKAPLTDEQITAIWSEKPRWHAAPIGETDLEFARAIERAHGIGEEGKS